MLVEYVVVASFLMMSWFMVNLFVQGAESYQRGYFQVLGAG
ncbi:hypothetical protein [Marinobacter confluentis]|nr:hypothetical protein [Marinobacter confluentis]